MMNLRDSSQFSLFTDSCALETVARLAALKVGMPVGSALNDDDLITWLVNLKLSQQV